MASDRANNELEGATAKLGSVDLSAKWPTSTLSPTGTPISGHPTAAGVPSVVVQNIGKSFGALKALRDVSFEVGPGEVVALLGPNGAGKTTTVNILSTLTRPDRGHASVAGYDVVTEAAGVRRSIMLTGQFAALDEMLTGRENLVLFGRLQDMRAPEARSRADELIRKFDLVDAADRRVGTYSGGMRRRIDIACGLVVPPHVVFLDEPTTGLDPRSRQAIWDLVTEFKSLGIATLLTTQYLEEADALSDRIIVIDRGVVVAEGTADELKERTGGSYCEVVPQDPKDLQTVANALGPLLPAQNRAALTADSDRLTVPAPGGAKTLLEVLSRLSTTNVKLADVALRRPSLDDVFLSLTGRPSAPDSSTSDQSTGEPTEHATRKHPQHFLRVASAHRVLSPVLAGLLVGGVIAALGLGGGGGDTNRPATIDTGQTRANVVSGGIPTGSCLTWPKDAPAASTVVQCADDHLFEVADSYPMDGRQAPCELAVQRYLGTHYDPNGKFTVTALWPSNAAEPSSDDDRLLCGLQLLDPNGQPIPFKGQVAQQDQSKIWPTGTCLGIDAATTQPTDDPVDCAAPHALEVTGTVNLGEGFSGPPPDPAKQDAFLENACIRMADAYLPGVPLKATGLTVHHGTVSPASWLAGSRQVSCGIGATTADDQGWATLTGTVTGGHLINGRPPVAPPVTSEPERSEPESEYEEAPVNSTSAPSTETVAPSSSTPTATTSPSPTATTSPSETATPTSQGPPPGGLVIAVPGFSAITLTPLPPPPPPGAPPPLPPPPPGVLEPPAQAPRPGP